VKAAGMMSLVGGARLHALELGLAETNTIERFRAAAALGHYTAEDASEITDAYQHLMRIRLRHQLDQLAAGRPPDNFLDPRRLSHADALLFRDALRTVARVQAGIAERYAGFAG
jgi:CBS domain-containing protein